MFDRGVIEHANGKGCLANCISTSFIYEVDVRSILDKTLVESFHHLNFFPHFIFRLCDAESGQDGRNCNPYNCAGQVLAGTYSVLPNLSSASKRVK